MNNSFISKVFRYLGLGLLTTFLVALFTSVSESILSFVYGGYTLIILFILQFGIAIYLPVRVTKMSSSMATILYLGYAGLTGLTLSSIFILYQLQSIIFIFLATAIIFFIFSFIGRSTKIDLNGFGIYLFIGLLSVIVLEMINIFILSNTLDMIICVISLVIFMGYIAFDMQNIIRASKYSNSDNIAVINAFNLYLDIINIFLKLLRMFGREK